MEFTANIYTLGCKVNQYESEAFAEYLEKNGVCVLRGEKGAAVAIVNTCTVTGEADRKCRNAVRRAVSENPGAPVIVTGCSAQMDPKAYLAIEGVSAVVGNREKVLAAKLALEYLKTGNLPTERNAAAALDGAEYEPMQVLKSERTRAYVKIEDGCESNCAYCIITKARGPIRSRTPDDVVSEVRNLVAGGYREVVLTGIEISAYGKGTDYGLADLILLLSGVEGLDRVRLGSLDPAIMTPAFVDKIAGSKNLAPHFHLSLQSGCDKTLRAMRRRYNTEMVRRYTEHIRKVIPDACFTADVIVGFPGETEEDFAETKRFLEEIGLLFCHVFPYSRRPGTEADKMPGQILKSVKSERVRILENVRDLSTSQVLGQYVGRTLPVLFEEYKGGCALGHSANFMEVSVESPCDLHNKMLDITFDKAENGVLIGKIADERTHI